MMKVLILITSFFLSLFGVSDNRRHIISLSNIKYERGGTHIEERMNVAGCFVSDSLWIPHSLVFYPDGTVIHWSPNDGRVTYNWQFNGVYTLTGDTIIANIYSSVDIPPRAWELESYKFVIRNRNTIEQIIQERHSRTGKDDYLFKPNYQTQVFHFVPTTHLPIPSIKWKKKKWLWKSEEEWLQFLKEHKLDKKLKK